MNERNKERGSAMTKSEAESAIRKYGDQSRAARGLGVSRKMIRWALYRADVKGAVMSEKKVQQQATAKPGNTLSVFRNQFDVRLKIRKGIKRFLAGVYMTDQQFREACGVPATEWRRYADESEFDGFRVKVRGVLYWAQPKMVAQMKEIAGIVS